MSSMKKPLRSENPSLAELAAEREQLLELRRQPNVDKTLIDLALKNTGPRLTVDEVNEYLGRTRAEQQ
jgi:hypothetical protein